MSLPCFSSSIPLAAQEQPSYRPVLNAKQSKHVNWDLLHGWESSDRKIAAVKIVLYEKEPTPPNTTLFPAYARDRALIYQTKDPLLLRLYERYMELATRPAYGDDACFSGGFCSELGFMLITTTKGEFHVGVLDCGFARCEAPAGQ